MVKVTTFGTVTIIILTGITIGFHGPFKKIFRLFYLVGNPGQIHQPEWRSIFID